MTRPEAQPWFSYRLSPTVAGNCRSWLLCIRHIHLSKAGSLELQSSEQEFHLQETVKQNIGYESGTLFNQQKGMEMASIQIGQYLWSRMAQQMWGSKNALVLSRKLPVKRLSVRLASLSSSIKLWDYALKKEISSTQTICWSVVSFFTIGLWCLGVCTSMLKIYFIC